MFALLDELSRRATWLVVVAPHKKPEVSGVPASADPKDESDVGGVRRRTKSDACLRISPLAVTFA